MEPIAITKAGPVRGSVHEETAVFLAIPYAQAPFAGNRFRAPVPMAGWDTTRDALAYGASAPQANRQFTLIPEPVIPGDECLNLNVFTPDLGAAGLPVLVWIHGGGFVAGSNASPWYRGERFGRDGIVVVSINYRLGIEGFLALEGAPMNRALLDWVAALEWVQENISAFGGDPDRVTIAGQSAGGAACGNLLMSPRAKGLFRGAILMSGVGLSGPRLERAQSFASIVAEVVGRRPTIDDFAGIAPSALVEAQDEAAKRRDDRGEVRNPLTPVVDGDTLPASVHDAVKSGVSRDIPVLLGSTAEEAVGSARAAADRIDEERVTRRLGAMGLDSDAIAGYLAQHRGKEPWQVLGQALTDSTFRIPALRFADARASSGDAGTWLYDFRWKTSVRGMGAVHCLDVPFAFDVLDASGVAEVTGPNPPQQLADEIHGSWVRFLTDGDPGWPRYELPTRKTKVFNESSDVIDDPWATDRAIWMS